MVRFSLKLCPFAMTTGMSREAVNDLPIVHAMWQMIRDQQQGSPSEVEAPEALVDHDDSDGDPPEPEQARNVRRRVAEQQFVRPPAPPAVPPPVDVSKLPRPPPPPAPLGSFGAIGAIFGAEAVFVRDSAVRDGIGVASSGGGFGADPEGRTQSLNMYLNHCGMFGLNHL